MGAGAVSRPWNAVADSDDYLPRCARLLAGLLLADSGQASSEGWFSRYPAADVAAGFSSNSTACCSLAPVKVSVSARASGSEPGLEPEREFLAAGTPAAAAEAVQVHAAPVVLGLY